MEITITRQVRLRRHGNNPTCNHPDSCHPLPIREHPSEEYNHPTFSCRPRWKEIGGRMQHRVVNSQTFYLPLDPQVSCSIIMTPITTTTVSSIPIFRIVITCDDFYRHCIVCCIQIVLVLTPGIISIRPLLFFIH